MRVRVLVTGRGYHTALELPPEVELPGGATVDDALATLAALLPDGKKLPPSCLIAVSGRHLGAVSGYESCTLREGDELVLITPVAGG